MVLLVAYNNVALIIGINKYVKVDYKADLMETHDAIDNIEKKIIEELLALSVVVKKFWILLLIQGLLG